MTVCVYVLSHMDAATNVNGAAWPHYNHQHKTWYFAQQTELSIWCVYFVLVRITWSVAVGLPIPELCAATNKQEYCLQAQHFTRWCNPTGDARTDLRWPYLERESVRARRAPNHFISLYGSAIFCVCHGDMHDARFSVVRPVVAGRSMVCTRSPNGPMRQYIPIENWWNCEKAKLILIAIFRKFPDGCLVLVCAAAHDVPGPKLFAE